MPLTREKFDETRIRWSRLVGTSEVTRLNGEMGSYDVLSLTRRCLPEYAETIVVHMMATALAAGGYLTASVDGPEVVIEVSVTCDEAPIESPYACDESAAAAEFPLTRSER